MPITPSEFLTMVTSGAPEAASTVQAHLDDNDGELSLHLLTADLRRVALEWFEVGRKDALARLLRLVETALRDGDEAVENAMAVSFVEDTGWWDASTQAFVAQWPPGLIEELEKQRLASS